MQKLDIGGLIVVWLSLDEEFEVVGCDAGDSYTNEFVFEVYVLIFFELVEQRNV